MDFIVLSRALISLNEERCRSRGYYSFIMFVKRLMYPGNNRLQVKENRVAALRLFVCHIFYVVSSLQLALYIFWCGGGMDVAGMCKNIGHLFCGCAYDCDKSESQPDEESEVEVVASIRDHKVPFTVSSVNFVRFWTVTIKVKSTSI